MVRAESGGLHRRSARVFQGVPSYARAFDLRRRSVRRRPSRRPASTRRRLERCASLMSSPTQQVRLISLARDPADCLNEREDGRAEQDDEHGREDEQNEWEQDLDRGLLCLLLRYRTSPPPHLLSEIAHDL